MHLLLVVLLCATTGLSAQDTTVRTLAFYNLENLYDTIDDPQTRDDERTPNGAYGWTRKRYRQKIDNLARTIAQIGKLQRGAPPDILGLCEVENRKVLDALLRHPSLNKVAYQAVHFDSPDERGIDVALVYNPETFNVMDYNKHSLFLYNDDGFRDYTRDQLVVTGYLDGQLLHVLVNHWPSRSGGTKRSAPYRKSAARLCLKIMDSIRRYEPKARFVIMGDFNDNPADASLAKILRAGKKRDTSALLFNPMFTYYRRGYGTLAFRDGWNFFDQIIVSKDFIRSKDGVFSFWKAGIYNPTELTTREGRYRGYPFRTYAGRRYTGGYSDHYPVYVYLRR